jgi:hypothetical protein
MFRASAAVSTGLLIPLLRICLFARDVDSKLAFANGMYVCVRPNGLDPRLAIFNDPIGPYLGSIVGLEGTDSPKSEVAFGDFAGIYYRYFLFEDGETNWTLMVSLWYPLVLFACLPTIWIFRVAQRSKLRRPT